MPRVSELLLIAAPSCCGKTRFLERVLDGRHDDLLALMGIRDPIGSYLPVLARELPQYRGVRVPRMILHFALPVVPRNGSMAERIVQEPALDFVPTCDNVTAVTLLASADVLRSRLRLRYRWTRRLMFKSIPRYVAVRKRLGKLIDAYEDPANFVAAYEAWFRYIESIPNLANRWLLTSDDAYELREPAQWYDLRNAYFGPSPAVAVPDVAPASAN